MILDYSGNDWLNTGHPQSVFTYTSNASGAPVVVDDVFGVGAGSFSIGGDRGGPLVSGSGGQTLVTGRGGTKGIGGNR